MATPQTRRANALHGVKRQIRHIDIEQNRSGGILFPAGKETLDDFSCHGRSRRQFRPPLVDLAERNGVDAEDIAFDGGGHRTRIHRIVAHVGAAVDAGHDQIGTVVEKPRQGQMHAIRGRSAHHEDIFGSVGYRKRFIERERIARAAVVMLGRYDGNAAESAHFVGKRIDAGRHVAVVIADENMHASYRPFGGLFWECGIVLRIAPKLCAAPSKSRIQLSVLPLDSGTGSTSMPSSISS